MGKRRPFIDKKRSTTYILTHRATPDHEDDAARRPSEYDEDPELAELLGLGGAYEDSSYQLNEQERKEILQLGLPDDGYNYLKHLREVVPRPPTQPAPAKGIQILDAPQHTGAGPSTSQQQQIDDGSSDGSDVDAFEFIGGPSTFIAGKFKAPAEDARLVDARALHIAGQMSEEEEVDAASHTISAFTRTAQLSNAHAPGKSSSGPHGSSSSHNQSAAGVSVAAAVRDLGIRGKLASELEELEKTMLQLEKQESDEDKRTRRAAAETEGSSSTKQDHLVMLEEDEEWADWLDEFVVRASAPLPENPQQQHAGQRLAQPAALPRITEKELGLDSDQETDEVTDIDDDEDHVAGLPTSSRPAGQRQPGPGSIASTYWRPERHDRKDGLQGIDEHFEQLALQYEDDDMGDLDDGDYVAEARGTADISAFTAALDEFLQETKAKPAFKAGGGSGKAAMMSEANRKIAAALGDLDEDDEDDESDMDDDVAVTGNSMQAISPQDGIMHGLGGGKKVEALQDRDEEVIAATKARLAAVAATTHDVADSSHGAASGAVGEIMLGDSLGVMVLDRGDRWDCESVLSLRSNLDNHPGRIVEPQRRTGNRGGAHITLSNKTGMPVTGLQTGGQQQQPAVIQEENEDDLGGSSEEEAPGLILERRKGETAEEKRARKAAVKEARRQNRAAKKELKGMFKSEAAKQQKQAAGRAVVGGSAQGGSVYVL